MVIVGLSGGLGNQLFQYAAGLGLAGRLGAPLRLDTAGYARQSLRSYRLGEFNISAGLATAEEVARVRGLEGRECPPGAAGLLCRALRRLALLAPSRRVVRERHYHFDPALLRQRAPAYLEGYWQSERYFHEIAPRVRRELTLRRPAGQASAELARTIAATEAVSVHVRRGDYAADPATRSLHGLCPPEYYAAAAAHIRGRVAEPRLFVFSDDPGWARAHLDLGAPTTFVAHNGPAHDHEDLWLMSCCRHHIIANSSFSWWGAWLSDAPGKLVVAPRRWFAGDTHRTDDLLPEAWHRL